MKYFISNYYDGCWYYRCWLPMLYNGFSGDKEGFDSVKDRQRDAMMALKADTVIFQRPDEEKKLTAALMLKQQGKKIVFENDDTFKDASFMKIGDIEKRNQVLDTVIRIADLVTTTTEFLADEYRKLNPNVVVLKNCINPSDFPTKPRKTLVENKKVRIGIFGSTTMNSDCEPIKDLLEELGERDDVQLVMFGLPPKSMPKEHRKTFAEDIKFWSKLNIEWQSQVPMKDYIKILDKLALDITLIPRQDNYFNRCKSNLKFLEASMLNIAVIAQGFEDGKSPYQGEEDSQYMLIAKNQDDFRRYVNYLLKKREVIVSMGKEAKEYVLKNYNIKKEAYRWAEAYKSIKL